MQTETSRLTSGTETIEARALRSGDTIIDPATGERQSIHLATRYGALVMIWTDTVQGFALSPSLTLTIARRDVPKRNPLRHDLLAVGAVLLLPLVEWWDDRRPLERFAAVARVTVVLACVAVVVLIGGCRPSVEQGTVDKLNNAAVTR
ncbi:hypothetical protein SAMN05216188_11882 [Lentzea xinjiangensis]|uniref:Uncharacterized protein n=1 Tax=Lentzea xinjiangensis TaxID=402600 RepID=A0A1H9TF46_9PSEU|nr:hypothetical protein [Lentzea xinjiangensis]SER95761.1 hypothetical protein SAMN05216188_11882 [Lentzea xinjiangensis]